MELDQIIRGLESHQGKWMTIYNNKIVIADNEEKLRAKVPAACEVRQVPTMIYGKTTWSNAISTIVQTLADKQPPADILREEKPQVEQVAIAAVEHDERSSFWSRLFGRRKRKEESGHSFQAGDAEVVYGGQ